MKYYAVIDTNVVVSAMLRWDSVPGRVLEHAFVGDIIPLLNEQVIKEYMEVLRRPKFHFDEGKINIIIDEMIKRGVFVDAEDTDVVLPDQKDAVFYEIVMEKRKCEEAFLVTGNIKHFPAERYIVTPREMLAILERGFHVN
ncbi:MAG: putative toxin-antitoxin system toxin component, PIN family [Lachnospiraceae bacterium]|nr:putative toxin-antitoxin system toxin component, PIN family [Lachnospiraceae bacterium]